MSSLSIVHAVAPGAVGGVESVVLALARGQGERGHRVHVVSVTEWDDPAHPFHRGLRQAGIDLSVLEIPQRSYLREVRELRASFRRLAPDLVHTHGYRSDVLAGRAARGWPRVSTAHGFTGGGWKNRVYETLQRRAYRGFDAVVAVARPLAARLRRSGVPSARLTLLPNAWTPPGAPLLDRAEARRALSLPSEAWVLGWVGRLSREKGPDVFLSALASAAGLGATAVLLGDGREREALEALTSRLGLTSQVRFAGVVPEAHRFYAAFDGFVLSSRTEGTPISLFEAMAAGVPVIATAVGGVPDVVGPAEALLVPPESAVALGAGLRALRDHPEAAAARAGAAALRLAQTFGLTPWLDRYDALYHAVLARRRSRSP